MAIFYKFFSISYLDENQDGKILKVVAKSYETRTFNPKAEAHKLVISYRKLDRQVRSLFKT
jgi:hypothetical protein